jgi:hypothetical protein
VFSQPAHLVDLGHWAQEAPKDSAKIQTNEWCIRVRLIRRAKSLAIRVHQDHTRPSFPEEKEGPHISQNSTNSLPKIICFAARKRRATTNRLDPLSGHGRGQGRLQPVRHGRHARDKNGDKQWLASNSTSHSAKDNQQQESFVVLCRCPVRLPLVVHSRTSQAPIQLPTASFPVSI